MLIVESADLPLRKNETNCHFLNTILLQPEKVVTKFFIFSQWQRNVAILFDTTQAEKKNERRDGH